MYRCPLCSRVAPPGTPSLRVVVETRPKTYPRRPNAHRVVRFEGKKKKVVKIDDPDGTGREVVREVTACPACAGRAG